MNRRTTISITLLGIVFASACCWQACKKNPNHHNVCGGPMKGSEPTTMMLVFTNINNPSDADTAVWSNMNANSGGAPVIDNSKAHLTLSANSSYRVRVYFLNVLAQQGSAAYDATPGVAKESSSYLVCFDMPTSYYGNLGASLGWVREDMDNSTVPMQLGLADSFWTGADSTCGLLQATLHHQWKVKNGDCNPGYIDIQAVDTVFVSPGKGK